MIQLTSCEIDDLQYCQGELRRVLAMLDTAGAGIAAIHVNAAIEQLDRNLRTIGKAGRGSEPMGVVSFLFPEGNE